MLSPDLKVAKKLKIFSANPLVFDSKQSGTSAQDLTLDSTLKQSNLIAQEYKNNIFLLCFSPYKRSLLLEVDFDWRKSLAEVICCDDVIDTHLICDGLVFATWKVRIADSRKLTFFSFCDVVQDGGDVAFVTSSRCA